MEKIFGVPLSGIMLFLSVALGAVVIVLIALGLRHVVLVKMGLRNIPRRKAQTSLIIIGLMLSTLIITAALGVGDTIAYSIKDQAITSLGNLDMQVTKVPNQLAALTGNTDNLYFKQDEYNKLKAQIEAAPNGNVKTVVPAIFNASGVQDLTSKQSHAESAIAGVPAEFGTAWGEIKTIGGKQVSLGDLGAGETYLTKEMGKYLNAKPGDELKVYIEKQPVTLKVKDTIDVDFDAQTPLAVMNLTEYQKLAKREGQTLQIWIGLKGKGGVDNIQYSADVTKYLRTALADNKAMTDMKALLSQSAIRSKLDDQFRKLQDTDPQKPKLQSFLTELDKSEVTDEFKSLSQDSLVQIQLTQLAGKLDQQQTLQLLQKATSLSAYRVNDIKASTVDLAELIGSFFTAFFTIFALFSISVGILLIFLIFVMLAAERKAEMGMSRALGTKRRHLTEMFVFEGTVYSMMAAFVGVLLGVGVGAGMVGFMASLIGSEGFKLKDHIEPRSLVISFCLGMLLTFLVVAISAYRVSRLNIVSAIRDLEEEGKRGKSLGYILLRPFRVIGRSFKQLARFKIGSFLKGLTLDLTNSFFGILMALFTRGPLALLIGFGLASAGISGKTGSVYTLGCSFIIIGLGLTLRWILRSMKFVKNDLADRLGYSLAGILLVIFWARFFGPNFFEKLLGFEDQVKDIDVSGLDMFFVSGIMLVVGAIWTVMYNSDLLVKGVMAITSRMGSFAPVTRTALAYPLASRYRTGMLLAMFSLVTFVIIFMSVLTDITGKYYDDKERSSGGWDITAQVSDSNNLGLNVPELVANDAKLKDQVTALGSTVSGDYTMHQTNSTSDIWGGYAVQAGDDNFLKNSRFKFSARGDGYATDEQILEALRTQPNLAIVPNDVLAAGGGNGGFGPPQFTVTGISGKAKTFQPFEVQIRNRKGGLVKSVTVIGFMDRVYTGYFGSMFVTRPTLAELSGLPVDQLKASNYFFDVKNDADVEPARLALGEKLTEFGIEPKSIAAQIKKDTAISTGFNTLFQLFAALGLLVGIAGLGVISTRVVVERRQQIGMLRAIGYSRRLVQLSFLLESSFIAILGLGMGALMGLWSAYKYVDNLDIKLDFSIPWVQVLLILGLSYIATLFTTFLPARAASRVYPADALRYE